MCAARGRTSGLFAGSYLSLFPPAAAPLTLLFVSTHLRRAQAAGPSDPPQPGLPLAQPGTSPGAACPAGGRSSAAARDGRLFLFLTPVAADAPGP